MADTNLYGSSGIKKILANLKAEFLKYTQKSQTSGLMKNDGTIDTTQYLSQHQDISGKADKVSDATNGNFAGLDSNGNLTDSGKNPYDFLGKVTTMPANPSLGDVVVYAGTDTAEFKKGHTYKAVAGDTFYGLTIEDGGPPVEERPEYPYDIVYTKELPFDGGVIENPTLYDPYFNILTNISIRTDGTEIYGSSIEGEPGYVYQINSYTPEYVPLNFWGYTNDALHEPKLITVTPVVWQEVIVMDIKADKVSGATIGNLAGLDSNGNLTDSGSKSSDFAASSHTHTKSQISDFPTLGTASSKDSTSSVTQSSTDLVESGAVYTAINTAIGNAVDNLLATNY